MPRSRQFLACLLLGVLAAFAAPHAMAERVALVIGNSEYAVNPLSNPVNDASDMADRLAGIGFRLHGDGPLLNQDLRAMQVAIRDFTRSLEAGDLAVFYFAGHGVEYKGTNYLIPTDDEEIAFADDVPDWAYPAPRLLERLAATGATGVIILDACRNNPLPERAGTRDVGTGLSAMETPVGASAFIMYAAAPGQTSSDGDGRNGLFTGALLEALERPNRRIDDIMYEVSFAVRSATRGRQVPWLEFAFAGEIPPQFQTGDGRVDSNQLPSGIESVMLSSAGKPGYGISGEGEALYGVIDLTGLTESPLSEELRLDMLAGGYEDATQLGGSCHGFVASDPDFHLTWEVGTTGPLWISTDSEAETVLVMRDPDGGWLCGGTASTGAAPVLELSEGPAGLYRIWVGTEVETAHAPEAELVVATAPDAPPEPTEPDAAPPPVIGEEDPDAASAVPPQANPAASIERGLELD